MKKAVVGFGRMNPSTSGHEVVAKKIEDEAKKRNAEARLYLSHTTNPKKDPLPYADKVKFATAAFKHLVKVINSPARTIIEVAIELEKQGFTEMTVVVGEDRVKEFNNLLQKYNGKDFTFDKIEVIKAGDRDPDADDVTGMSASKMRKLASEGNFEAFAKGAPSKLSKAMVKQMYDKVRKNMRIAEMFELDSDQEILDEFTVISSYSKKELDDKLKVFTKRKDRYRKLIRTPLSDDFDVYYYESGGFHEYIFTEKDTEEPVGQFEIEMPFGGSKRPKIVKPGIKIVTPHLSFVEKYQRKGLARKTYLAFLRMKNYAFKSDRHTKEAASLWDSLAKERDIVTFYYDEESGEVSKTKMDTGIDEVKFLGLKSDFNLPKDITEACWAGYTQKGLKKKGNRMVPNCVPEENEVEEAVLTFAQRRSRGMRLRRMQKRIQRARARQMKRFADPARLRRRAMKAAFKALRARFSGGKDYASMGTAEKIGLDKRLQKALPMVKKLAVRLLPTIRKREIQRKKSMAQHANEMFEEVMLERTTTPQDKDIKGKEGSQPSVYHAGLAKSTKEKRDTHFKKYAEKPDSDPDSYKDAPGDKEAREKGLRPSVHTIKFKKMFGEEVSKKELGRLDMLVRMGLADKKLLQIIKRSVTKLGSGETLTPQERQAAFDLLQTLLDMTLSTDQLFRMTRMQLQKENLDEAAYPGNVGAEEMVKFFRKATPEQKAKLKQLIQSKDKKSAWQMVQQVSGTKLMGKQFEDVFGIGTALSPITHSKNYDLAKKALNDVLKRKDSGKNKLYYAAQVARSYQGVDAKKLASMVKEDWDDSSRDGISMAQIELENLIDDAEEILEILEGHDEEPDQWVLSKITKANDYISAARDYLDYSHYDDEEDDEEDDEDDEDDFDDEMIDDALSQLINDGLTTEEYELIRPITEEIEGLKKKAEKSGIAYGILKKVYDRGMAAWKSGHRPGATPQQWAFARVNSFITKGKGTWGGADKDLASKVSTNEDFKKKFGPLEIGTDAMRIAYARMTPGQNLDLVTAKYSADTALNVLNDIRTQRLKKQFDEEKNVIKEAIEMHLDKKIPFVDNVFRVGSEKYFEFFREARAMNLQLEGLDKYLIEETDIGEIVEFQGQHVPLDCPMVSEWYDMDEEELLETIKHEGSKWVIYSKDGSKKLGEYDTKEDAVKRLRQIEYFKSMKEEEEKDPPLNKPKRGGPKKFYVYVRKPDGGIKKVTWGDTTGLSVKMNDPEARKSFAARHQCSMQKDRTSAAYWACNTPRYAKQLGLSGGGNFFW